MAAEGVHRVDKFGGHTCAGTAVAVNLYLLGSLVDAYAAHGRFDLLNGAVGVKEDTVNAG